MQATVKGQVTGVAMNQKTTPKAGADGKSKDVKTFHRIDLLQPGKDNRPAEIVQVNVWNGGVLPKVGEQVSLEVSLRGFGRQVYANIW